MKRLPSHETFLEYPETNCRRLRRQKKWTLDELAFHSGVSYGTVRRMDSAQNIEDLGNMYITNLLKVALALGVSPAGLWPVLSQRPEAWEEAL